MQEEKKSLEKYEKPTVEIVEFSISESIALSGDLSPDAACTLFLG